MKMKKHIACLCLPLLVGLAACSKGDKVESVEEKRAIVNQVAEGVTKSLGKSDFVFDLSFKVDGEVTLPDGKITLDDFELQAQGEFDFPETLEKGSDIANIKAHLGIETDGDIEFVKEGATTHVDCDSKICDFFFEEGTFYADIYKSNFSEFLVGQVLNGALELPLKSKLNLSELIDPNSVIDLQKDFETPEIDDALLNAINLYVASDEYTFEIDSSEVNIKDDAGVERNVKDFLGVDIEASLVIDKEFRLTDFEVEGTLDIAKLDEGKKASGKLDFDFDLNVNYKANPEVKSVSNKEEYKQFKLFSK